MPRVNRFCVMETLQAARAHLLGLRIVAKEDRSALLSQNRFYAEVYKPRRDSLVERWNKLMESAGTASVKRRQK